MILKIIMLSEGSQSQKGLYFTFSGFSMSLSYEIFHQVQTITDC